MTDDPLTTALLTARVPRYTSYPPADRFGPEVGSAAKTRWLGEIRPGARIALYLHVPFCRRLCWFCACRSQGTQAQAPLERYLDTLADEIALTRAALPCNVEVASLHLGGGTPTILSADQLDRLGALLGEGFCFASGAEVSVEIDPCDFGPARRDALLRLGLSRASIGVQDFDPLVQRAIGRLQSAEETARAVDLIRAGGIGSLNVDLLYGLPHQTPARLLATLDTTLGFMPDRIALYGYAHVPWAAKRQKLIDATALPGPRERLLLADTARSRLMAAGYVPIGIDHFARPGDSMAVAAAQGALRRNFQGYTVDADLPLVGLGPSAISQLPQGFVQNAPATALWAQMVEQGQLPGARGIVVGPAARAMGRVIAALMCDGRADLPALTGDLAPDMIARAHAALDALPGAGRLDKDGVLELEDIRFARLVAHRIDSAAETGPRRYSQAC